MTNGGYILPFRRGAFNALMPVKPYLVKRNPNSFNIGVTPFTDVQHMLLTGCFFYHNLTIYDLPVIQYTESLKMQKTENEDDVANFIRCIENIYVELGELTKSEKGLNESKEYSNIVTGVKSKERKEKSE